jgi:hypothetical protein
MCLVVCLDASKHTTKHTNGVVGHARHPKEQARVWHSIAHFHHTPTHPIYWEDQFASCVRGQALPLGDLNSAFQDGLKRGSFEAN